MLPMKALRLALGELLAADVTLLAPVAANKIALVSAAFALTESIVIGGLTLATFTGSTPKAGAAGSQQAGVQSLTGQQVITILAPAGGWRWECTATPGVPETIYGFALIDDAGAVVLAAAVLDTPVTIAAIGDFIDLGAVSMQFVIRPLS